MPDWLQGAVVERSAAVRQGVKLCESRIQGMPTPEIVNSASHRDERELRNTRFALRLSLFFGLAMLIGKMAAYAMTHSAAIFSDAAESVIHVIAVGFATFSLRLSAKPASSQFLYGYERIAFFSAGFEGAMIVVAAITIFFESARRWIAGLQLEHLGAGALLILAAGILNGGLGYYLLRVGRRTNSLILEANGKHVLTDSCTSFGVVGGIGLVLLTHWKASIRWWPSRSPQIFFGREGVWSGVQLSGSWIIPTRQQGEISATDST